MAHPKANKTSFKPGESGNPEGRPATGLDSLPEGWKDDMIAAAKEGASMVELRVIAGLRNTTFYKMQEREPDFADVVEHCKDLAEVWYEKKGRGLITGAVTGNATVWYSSMKNKFGWRDKTDVDIRTPDGVQVQTSTMTDAELQEHLKRLGLGRASGQLENKLAEK